MEVVWSSRKRRWVRPGRTKGLAKISLAGTAFKFVLGEDTQKGEEERKVDKQEKMVDNEDDQEQSHEEQEADQEQIEEQYSEQGQEITPAALDVQLQELEQDVQTRREAYMRCEPSRMRALVDQGLVRVAELKPRLLQLNLGVHGLAARGEEVADLRRRLVEVYSLVNKHRQELEQEARKVPYLYMQEQVGSYEEHVRRLEQWDVAQEKEPGECWFTAGWVMGALILGVLLLVVLWLLTQGPQHCQPGPFSLGAMSLFRDSGPRPF